MSETFAKRLRRLREAAGMTRYRLADLAGLRQQSIFNLEDGKSEPKFATVIALAAALGLSIVEFVTDDLKPKKRGK